MTTAWTENNDGVTLPNDLDASEHSGASEPEIELCEHGIPLASCVMCNCAHDGGFTAGELPGGRKIVHCVKCGMWKDAE